MQHPLSDFVHYRLQGEHRGLTGRPRLRCCWDKGGRGPGCAPRPPARDSRATARLAPLPLDARARPAHRLSTCLLALVLVGEPADGAYGYGFRPGYDYYALPYGQEEVAGLEPFDYDRFETAEVVED